MWNPPPPDIQVVLNRRPDFLPSASYRSSCGPNAPAANNQSTTPKITLNTEQAPPIASNNSSSNNLNYNAPTNQQPETTNMANTYGAMQLGNRSLHPRLEKVGPYLAIATLQAYTVLTVVRCLADPVWIVLKSSNSAGSDPTHLAEIGSLDKVFLSCAIGCTMLSCIGVTLRILDKMPRLRKPAVITAYLEAIFCIGALASFLSSNTLPPEGQFSHGFLACIITVFFSTIVSIMLTIDWWRGFPSAGLTATLKGLIISSFVMTTIIIIGAAIYSALEDWTFDQAVNFCIVSFATIGYGNLSPKTIAGRIIFFFYALLGISSIGFFVVSLRNAVIEQFQWRLVDRFSKPAHLTRVQTRMSAKDISFPAARLEEEQRVKVLVKRKMMIRMMFVWIVMWFGGAGIFCALSTWTYLESLYFCFVTLTTIGFGDYVPESPGAIEFWNVYVFIGLAVFAYILSLSSESMASHIHLVDDQDENNDDNMYGWERNEDPNAPLTTRSAVLGLEGSKWLQQRRQDQQESGADDMVDAEGKPIVNNNLTRPIPGGDANVGGDQSVQSTVQRGRSSAGRILMVSARERRQMLEAEYYAANTLPTTIRFVDTQGVPHQRTVGRGTADGSISGPSGTSNLNEQPGFTYGTEGYYSTINRGDLINARKGSILRNGLYDGGVGIDRRGTMYGAGSTQLPNSAQTYQPQHQPLIRFDSPNSSMRGDGGQPNAGPSHDRQGESDDRRVGGTGYIPSCIDVFRQGRQQQQQQQSARREDPSRQGYTFLPSQGSPIARVRSNSWDQSASNQRQGPSPNEIHRWLAEGAGTLQGPNFGVVQRSSDPGPLDVDYGVRGSRPSQGSDITRVTSPPLGTTGESLHDYLHQTKERNSVGQHGPGIVEEEQRYHREGIAPDEMPMPPLSAEPAPMNEEESAAFHAGHNASQNDSAPGPGPRAQSPVFIAQVREPTMPATSSSSDETATPAGDVPGNLVLGGGVGAAYGPYAYGVPVPGSGTGDDAGVRGRPRERSEMNEDRYLSPAEPPQALQLFDDEGDYNDDHQHTMRVAADSRPPSLFSNHPQSSQSSREPSCAGSVHRSRPPSVLMTIFDEPVLSRPASQSVSRTSPVSAAAAAAGSVQPRPRADSGAPHAEAGKSDRAQRGSTTSEVSVGPLDETRNPELMPHFDQDVDLNHLELQPEQYEQERRRRADLIRRRREIEARLARLGAKGRGDYDQ